MVEDIRKHPFSLIDDDIGEVVKINTSPDDTILVRLPKQPPNNKILGHEFPKEEQYWRRPVMPAGLTRATKERYASFILEELRKTREGVWFFNNGKATYITGLHYYYIGHIEIDVGPPDYRERDRKFFYTWRAVEMHQSLKGLILVKPRRMGASWIGAAILLYKLTRTKKALGGILSKTGTDAKEFFTEKVVIAYQSLPFWLQPLTSSGSDPKTALVFNKPSESGKAIAKQGVDTSIGLRSKVDWRNTKLRSYDSMKLTRLVYDECGKIEGKMGADGKWVGINLTKQWDILSKTLGIKKKVGVAFLPSTVEDLTAGGEQFKRLFESSLLSRLNKNGNTPSGLLGYFIPAYDGLEGFVDIYGRSIINDPPEPVRGIDGDWITQGSKTYLDNERAGILDQADLIEFKRGMPYTLREAFYDKSGNSVWNLGRMQTQLDWMEDSDMDKFTTRGFFQWKNGIRDSSVEFIHSQTGRFEVAFLPKHPNVFTMKGGLKTPVNVMQFAGGVDSYDINRTSHGTGSNGAFCVFCKENLDSTIPEANKNSFVLTYLSRESKAVIFYEQVLMAAVYFSVPVLAENNKPRILNYFEERGYTNYMVVRPDKHIKDLTKNERELKGIPSNEGTNVLQAELFGGWIEDEVGMKEDGSMGRVYHFELLDDFRKFRLEKRTKYDLSVAAQLSYLLATKNTGNIRKVSGMGKGLARQYRYVKGRAIQI